MSNQDAAAQPADPSMTHEGATAEEPQDVAPEEPQTDDTDQDAPPADEAGMTHEGTQAGMTHEGKQAGMTHEGTT